MQPTSFPPPTPHSPTAPQPNITIHKSLWQRFKKFKHKKPLLSLFTILILVSALAAATFLTQFNQETRRSASGNTASLTLNPSASSVSPGEKFTVDVILDTKTNSVTATNIALNFDPNLITLDTFTTGNFLPVTLAPPIITSNQATITIASNPDSPQTGAGIIAQASFTAKNTTTATTTTISLNLPQTQVSAIGNPGNILGSTTPTSITILNLCPSPMAAPSPDRSNQRLPANC